MKRLNDDAPVYTVEPENGNGKQRTLHRTLLLPCDSLPIDNPKDIPLHTSRKNCQKQNIKQHRRHQSTKKEVADHPFASLDNSSEDEETLTFYPCDLEVKPSTSCTASNEADITTSVDTELLPESSDQQQYFDSPDNLEATHENVLPTEPVNDLSHTPIVDVLLDDCESSAQPSVTEDMNTSQRPQRTRKAPTRFTYTTPGKPVDCQLNQIVTVPNFLPYYRQPLPPPPFPFHMPFLLPPAPPWFNYRPVMMPYFQPVNSSVMPYTAYSYQSSSPGGHYQPV